MASSAPKIQDWVIDTDTHITEPGDLWTSRLPARYRDLAPQIVRDPATNSDVWRMGDQNTVLKVVLDGPVEFPIETESIERQLLQTLFHLAI